MSATGVTKLSYSAFTQSFEIYRQIIKIIFGPLTIQEIAPLPQPVHLVDANADDQ